MMSLIIDDVAVHWCHWLMIHYSMTSLWPDMMSLKGANTECFNIDENIKCSAVTYLDKLQDLSGLEVHSQNRSHERTFGSVCPFDCRCNYRTLHRWDASRSVRTRWSWSDNCLQSRYKYTLWKEKCVFWFTNTEFRIRTIICNPCILSNTNFPWVMVSCLTSVGKQAKTPFLHGPMVWSHWPLGHEPTVWSHWPLGHEPTVWNHWLLGHEPTVWNHWPLGHEPTVWNHWPLGHEPTVWSHWPLGHEPTVWNHWPLEIVPATFHSESAALTACTGPHTRKSWPAFDQHTWKHLWSTLLFWNFALFLNFANYCNPGNFSKLINLVNCPFWRFISH